MMTDKSREPPGRRIRFTELGWTGGGPGARSKQVAAAGKHVRLMEITPELMHPEWCVKGQAGFVIEGTLEMRFEKEVVQYCAGDAFIIPFGDHDKHIPRALSPRVTLLLFEEDR
jgi:quercetin dioxygenase-like cupin family protein